MSCKTCGEHLVGDGYTVVVHCPNAEVKYLEPDAEPVHCVQRDTYAAGTVDELWYADPNCEHDVRGQNRGGVACIKCGGWFCY